MPEEIPGIFHNISNYDYQFTIKELAEEIEWQFACLGKGQLTCIGENTEIYKTFLVLMKKEKIGTKGKDWECNLKYTNVKDDLKYNNVYVNWNYQKKFDENLMKRFVSKY